MTSIITRKVCLEPMYLDSNIQQHLSNKIREITKNECSNENGYILSINKIVEITNNYISSANSDIVFTVKFEANILKPEIGMVMNGCVCMILPRGIFVDVQEKLKVLIPKTSLVNYTLDNAKMCYESETHRICKDDLIDIKIEMVQYSEKTFICIGSLVETIV
jgi:DNA-directed RNA polymerase subunit E'/Rpb7